MNKQSRQPNGSPHGPRLPYHNHRNIEWRSTLSPQVQSILDTLNARFPYTALMDEHDDMIDAGYNAFADFSNSLDNYDVDLYDGITLTWGASEQIAVVALKSNDIFVLPYRCTQWHHWRLDAALAKRLRKEDK